MSDKEKLNTINNSKDYANGNGDHINNFDENYFDNFGTESNMEDADEDLLALLDMISAQDYNAPYEGDLLEVDPTEVNEEPYAVYNDNQADDIIALDENEFNYETETDLMQGEEEEIDPLLDSILGLNEDQGPAKTRILGELDDFDHVKNEDTNDVGSIFSNVLSAVDLLDDKTEEEFVKITRGLGEEKVERLSFFQRIFGRFINKNKSPKDDTTSQTKESKVKESKVKDKKVKDKKEANAKKESDAAKTKNLKNKSKKNSKGSDKEIDAKGSKQKNQGAKKAKSNNKAAKKKAAKEKPKLKMKDLISAIEADITELKISKLGMIFVVTFIILCSGFVILGTNAYSYNLNMKNAKTNFERGRYTLAYNEIYGLDVRKQDQVTYDKIMTVMYIYKEVNSYNINISMEQYPEALDSLLKGLERYDKYLDHATELGIKKDLDSVKSTILESLDGTFGITEDEAKELNAVEDQSQYSIEVINIAQENTKKLSME
ncbi:MAG: hypothetical protein ACK5JH_13035 [Anaerocolumna sp.]